MYTEDVKKIIHNIETREKTLHYLILNSNVRFKFEKGFCLVNICGATLKFSCTPTIKIVDDGWNNEYVEIGYTIRVKPSEIYQIELA